MISHSDLFLWARHADNRLPDERSVGKWLVFGPRARLERQFSTVNDLVDAHEIYRAKLTLPFPKRHPLAVLSPTLMIYADDETRYQTLDVLLARDIIPSAWKYDWESVRDTAPDGPLRVLYEKLSARRKP